MVLSLRVQLTVPRTVVFLVVRDVPLPIVSCPLEPLGNVYATPEAYDEDAAFVRHDVRLKVPSAVPSAVVCEATVVVAGQVPLKS